MLITAKMHNDLGTTLENMESLNSIVIFSDNYDEFEFNIRQFMYKEEIKPSEYRSTIKLLIKYNMDMAKSANFIDEPYYKSKLEKIDTFLRQGGLSI